MGQGGGGPTQTQRNPIPNRPIQEVGNDRVREVFPTLLKP